MHTHWKIGALGVASLLLLIQSCQKPASEPDQPASGEASFELIQSRILTPTCATSGCHASEKDGSFNQHRLVLAASVAYSNLVGVAPTNSAAKTDGLLRVKAFNAQESLLFHKLNPSASHHSGKSYGNPMPLGSTLLTVGQIEFIRRWIEAGAPREGSVADAALLDDKTPTPQSGTFEALAAPAAGTGYQLRIEPFSVAPNFERELFLRKTVGNTQDVYVNRFAVAMRNNSHHFVAYNFRNSQSLPNLNEVRDLRNSDNSLNLLTALSMQNHVYLIGTQTPTIDYTFPEGTALRIPANTTLDLNSHYVNKTSAALTGEVYMNLYTVDQSKVQRVVQTMDFGNTNLTIPAKTRVTLTRTFTMSKPIKILTLTSHTHQLGEKFVVKIKGGKRDGEVVYTTTDWQHPDIVTYQTPIELLKGEALVSEITYNNTTSKDVKFGLTSEDEMGIIFGYYYEE